MQQKSELFLESVTPVNHRLERGPTAGPSGDCFACLLRIRSPFLHPYGGGSRAASFGHTRSRATRLGVSLAASSHSAQGVADRPPRFAALVWSLQERGRESRARCPWSVGISTSEIQLESPSIRLASPTPFARRRPAPADAAARGARTLAASDYFQTPTPKRHRAGPSSLRSVGIPYVPVGLGGRSPNPTDKMEPTIRLERTTCSLRVSCSTS